MWSRPMARIWVVNGDAVGKVDPKTNALALNKFIPTDEGAEGIAAGGNAIWVACAIGQSVVEIDPKTRSVGRQDQGREPHRWRSRTARAPCG